jgi:hypothetical protein
LAGQVEPYARDVILEGPFGVYHGRKMAMDLARDLQDWSAPYSEEDKRRRVERIVSKNQEAKDVFYTKHELRWEEAGKPVPDVQRNVAQSWWPVANRSREDKRG